MRVHSILFPTRVDAELSVFFFDAVIIGRRTHVAVDAETPLNPLCVQSGGFSGLVR
jgi:hypothetical protein